VDRNERFDAACEENLLQLGRLLQDADYRFVTITPESHRRVTARASGKARSLRDVFGWNLPFEEGLLPAPIRESFERSGMASSEGELRRDRKSVV